MKRILSLVLVMILTSVVFAGCGKTDRVLYNEKLTKYIDLGEYKGIKIDTASDEYKKVYDSIISSDIQNNNFYSEIPVTDGIVENNDIVNIDYKGKKNGVAFDGGTAEGYDLTIGSSSFIDGFESGLIGKKIGETVDLNLTFPKDYGNEELNGAAVVFTVKINSAKKPLAASEYCKELGFGSEANYLKNVNEKAAKEILVSKLVKSSKIKKYPEKEQSLIYDKTKEQFEQGISSYGYDFASYLSMVGQTEEQFKNDTITNQIKPLMDAQMVLYAVLDKEKLEVTSNDINAQAENVVKQYNNEVTVEQVKEYYGEYQLEYMAVNEKAINIIYKNAVIK